MATGIPAAAVPGLARATVLNILLDHGITDPAEAARIGDGIHDDTDAFENLVAQAALATTHSGCAERSPIGATVIRLPPFRDGGAGQSPVALLYRITRPLELPGDRPISVVGSADHATTVVLERGGSQDDDGYLFIVAAGTLEGLAVDRFVRFEGLRLMRGGIRIREGVTGAVTIRACTFQCCPEWAIDSGAGTVAQSRAASLRVIECMVSDGAGGLRIGTGPRNAWIRSSQFVGNGGNDLRIAGSLVSVSECTFALRRKIAVDPTYPFSRSPHVVITPGAGPDIRFNNCRFGPDTEPVPLALVVLGEDDADTPSAWSQTPVQGVRFEACHFGGVAPGSTTAPPVAIALRAPHQGLQVVGGSVSHVELFFDEVWARSVVLAGALASPGNPPLKAIVESNASHDSLVSDLVALSWLHRLFSDGGRAFEVRPTSAVERWTGRAMATDRASTNVLYATGSLLEPRWQFGTQTGSITEGAGPLWQLGGGAFRISPTGPDSWVSQDVGAESVHRLRHSSAVFSVWLSAAALGDAPTAWAALTIEAGHIVLGGSQSALIPLTQSWSRHFVVAEHVAPGTTGLRVKIWLRSPDGGTPGGIRVALPQLEGGCTPTDYMPNSSHVALRAESSFQALRIGGQTLEAHSASGTGVPGSIPDEQHEVGDTYLTDDFPNGPFAWVCTEAGSPGQWRPFT